MDIQGSEGVGPQKNNDDDKKWTVVMKREKDNPMKEESSPSIITRGVRIGGGVKAVIEEGNSGFTATQLKELEVQTLIHKHFAAGLPVPFHLVLPMWKSVATTYGTSRGAIYKQYPSFVGFSPQGLDYRNMMDPEPGRCRRTDGKKWRCSRNVVPDQKYCVQHMHRGRQRSRKPVEASEIASPSSATRPNNIKFKLESSTPNLSTSVGLQLMTRSSDNTDISHGNMSITNSYYGSKKRVSCTSGTISSIAAMTTNITIPATAVTSNEATTTTAFRSTTNNQIIGNNDSGNHAGNNCIIRGSSNNEIVIAGRNLSPGLGFSPKSVLRVIGCSNNTCFDRKSGMELEPGRCRRTDGKKWWCSRNVIPDQKYCGRHMHRGAKKRVKNFQRDTGVAASAATFNTPWLPRTTAIPCRTVRAIPNTNLSISIPESPEKSNSSASSDTTLTDTSITASAISSNVS